MKMDRNYQVAAYAEDLETAVTFYKETLGAMFIAKYDPPGLAFFDFGELRLLLEKGAPKTTLYFWVENIEGAYADLKAKGVAFIDEPHLVFPDESGLFGKPGEEEWMVFFNDPAGNTLALVTRKPM